MCKIHVAAYIQVNNVKDFTNGGEKIQPILASIFLILQAFFRIFVHYTIILHHNTQIYPQKHVPLLAINKA